MSTATSNAPSLTIDVKQDLDSASDLSKFVSSQSNVLLQLGSVLARFVGQPVSSAVGTSYPTIQVTATPQWTAGPVTFSLTPTASCAISIASAGEPLAVALKVDDPTTTTNVQLPAATGLTYINIDLDFGISGNASGSGSAYGFTISGKAAGSATTTLSFCQPVPSNTETVAALKMAFSQIVFPTAPDCALRMALGSSCRMNFDGTLSWEIDASYGLGSYKVSAPSAALVQQSLKSAWTNLTLPTATISAGAKASVQYTHADHFGLVIIKKDGKTALFYLVRSSNNETSGSVGITVGVTTTNASVSFDATQIQKTVQTLTGSATLASSVATQVAQPVNNLLTSATAKLNSWVADAKGNIGLSDTLSQQNTRIGLFNYEIDLTQPTVAQQSWSDLLTSKVQDATKIPGFSLVPGSGVTSQLQRSSTLQFQFFGLYKYSSVQTFFDRCTAELAADGTIQVSFDVGIDAAVTTNGAQDEMKIHFTATATEDTQGNVSNAEIELNVEISEKGDSGGAIALAKILGEIQPPSQASVFQSIIDSMNVYAQSNPGTLSLVAILKPSAYARLTYSPYVGGKPPQDQANDMANWNAVHKAAMNLMNFEFIKPWTYADWGTFNSYCNDGTPGAVPSRKNPGNWGATPGLPVAFWQGFVPALTNYFLRALAEGMNLFEDLVTLAKDITNVVTQDQVGAIEQRVSSIVKGDFNIDYSKPIAAAVLSQAAAAAGSTVVASYVQAKDSSAFTTTLTIS